MMPDVSNVVHATSDIPTSINMQDRIFSQELDLQLRPRYASRMASSTLSRNVSALRKYLGLTQKDFAELVETQQANISKWESGQTAPEGLNLSTLSEIAKVTGREFSTKVWTAPVPEDEPDIPPTVGASRNDETIGITRINFAYALGPGTSIDDYIEEEIVRFDLDYVRSITHTAPSMLRIARGVGESMYPTIQSNDEVWVDASQRMLNLQDRIWAISLFGAAAIKRLRTIGKGKILVISDNPAVPDQEVDEEDLIIGGRVFRLARDI